MKKICLALFVITAIIFTSCALSDSNRSMVKEIDFKVPSHSVEIYVVDGSDIYSATMQWDSAMKFIQMKYQYVSIKNGTAQILYDK